MPTYEYECPACRHRFEKFQGISDRPVKTCPKCKGRKVRRLIGRGAGLLFKGSGFYSTDYRSDAYTKSAKADSAPPPAPVPAPAGASEPAKEKPGKKSEEKPAKPAKEKPTKSDRSRKKS